VLLGFELIRGDLNAVGMGTATYVEGDRILAFGHPAFGAGQLEAPAVLGEVHAIMSSMQRSFKMATSAGEIGALIGDWQSCVVADTKRQARMIPVTIAVQPSRSRPQRTLRRRSARQRSPHRPADPVRHRRIDYRRLRFLARHNTRVGLTIELADRTIQISDTFFNPSAASTIRNR